MACSHCGRPFKDVAALAQWQVLQELKALRQEVAAAPVRAAKERRNRQSNMQGCGCLLLIAALLLAFVPVLGWPFTVVFGITGFVFICVGFAM